MLYCRLLHRLHPRCRVYSGIPAHFSQYKTQRLSSSLPSQRSRSIAPAASSSRVCPSSGPEEIYSSHKIEEERFANYVAERYYPVQIGVILLSRYQIITKLGFGATSTIWLCRDLQDHRYLTLKVHVRSKIPNSEIELSNYMKSIKEVHGGEGFVRRAIDSFYLDGPHGTHCCILYEPTGIDISGFIHRLEGRALPEQLLRPLTRYVLIGLDYLHQLHIMHTDIQPKNILLGIDNESNLSQLEKDEEKTPVARKHNAGRTIYLSREMPITQGTPVISDLGEARRSESKQTGLIQPNIYRSPEVMLNMEWDNKVDIWALGQTIWTVFERGHLFKNLNPMGELDNARRFAEMISLMGPPPLEFLRRSKDSSQYWDENGNWKLSDQYPIPDQTLESREIRLQGNDKEIFLQFMTKLLRWLPEERPGAQELLMEDEWVVANEY